MDFQGANLNSIPALKEFRAAMSAFGERATDALYEVHMEIQRMLDWLIQDRPAYWKNELRRAWDQVTEARNELERCRRNTMGGERPTCYEQKKALEEARSYVRYCMQKAEAVKHWTRVVQHEISEYEGSVGGLHSMLESDVPQAVAALDRMISALESYTSIAAPTGAEAGKAEAGAAGGGGAGQGASMARGDGAYLATATEDGPPDYASLRQRAPSPQVRAQVEPEGESGHDPGDGMDFKRMANANARSLGFGGSWPDWNGKVLVAPGALDVERVYMYRRETGEPGDTGWFIGRTALKGEATDRYEAIRLGDLRERRPALLEACSLPAGMLALFDGDRIREVVDEQDQNIWRV